MDVGRHPEEGTSSRGATGPTLGGRAGIAAESATSAGIDRSTADCDEANAAIRVSHIARRAIHARWQYKRIDPYGPSLGQ